MGFKNSTIRAGLQNNSPGDLQAGSRGPGCDGPRQTWGRKEATARALLVSAWCFRSLKGPAHRPHSHPCRPPHSTWAVPATVNGTVQPDGLLPQWEGERPAGRIFINPPPGPCGGQRGSARAGDRPWASAPTEPRLVWAAEGRQPGPRLGQEQAGSPQLGLHPRPLPGPRRRRAVQRHF